MSVLLMAFVPTIMGQGGDGFTDSSDGSLSQSECAICGREAPDTLTAFFVIEAVRLVEYYGSDCIAPPSCGYDVVLVLFVFAVFPFLFLLLFLFPKSCAQVLLCQLTKQRSDDDDDDDDEDDDDGEDTFCHRRVVVPCYNYWFPVAARNRAYQDLEMGVMVCNGTGNGEWVQHSIDTLGGSPVTVMLPQQATIGQCRAAIEHEAGHRQATQQLYCQDDLLSESELPTELLNHMPMPTPARGNLLLVLRQCQVQVSRLAVSKPCCGRQCELGAKGTCCWCADKRKRRDGDEDAHVQCADVKVAGSRCQGYCKSCKLQPFC